MRFKVDDLVAQKDKVRPHTSYEIYKVVGILNDNYIAEHYGSAWEGQIYKGDCELEPGSKNWQGAYIRFREADLITPEEYLTEKNRLEDEESRLNSEFETIRAQFRKNLDEAADLINQSTTMAEACNKNIRDSLKNDFRNLFHALDKAGWSASFTRC